MITRLMVRAKARENGRGEARLVAMATMAIGETTQRVAKAEHAEAW